MLLSQLEADGIDAFVQGVESRTGVQVVTAVVGKCDAYAEVPWRAFALGASLAASVVVAADLLRPDWVTSRTALLHALLILGAALAMALLTVFLPAFGRLFLGDTRCAVEVGQYARALFLERELFRAPDRMAVLLLVSLFERHIEILPDVAVRDRVTADAWTDVVKAMRPALRGGRSHEALVAGLQVLEAVLARHGFEKGVTGANALPDRPIEEAGI